MKYALFLFGIIGVSLLAFFTGCQKENKKVSAPVPAGFSPGSYPKMNSSLRISSSSQTLVGELKIKLATGTAPAAISFRPTDNSTTLISNYNTANGTSIQVLPRSLWTIPDVVEIPAGASAAAANITVSSTASLDFNKLYGIGLTLADGDGYKTADSSRNFLLILRITNVLDGRYTMMGRFYSPSLEPGFARHSLIVELHTTGANSVALYWPFAGFYVTPSTSGGGNPYCCLFNNELSITTSVSSTTVTPVNSNPVGPVYADLQTYNAVAYTNYYDPVNNRIYLAFGRNLGAGGTLFSGVSTVWIDTLVYTGPR